MSLTYRGKRSELYLYSEGVDSSLIHVYLGDKDDPESEHILTVHTFYIDSLIAILSLAKQTLNKQR